MEDRDVRAPVQWHLTLPISLQWASDISCSKVQKTGCRARMKWPAFARQAAAAGLTSHLLACLMLTAQGCSLLRTLPGGDEAI